MRCNPPLMSTACCCHSRVTHLQIGKAQLISIKDVLRPSSDIRGPKQYQTEQYYAGIAVSCLYYGDQRRIRWTLRHDPLYLMAATADRTTTAPAINRTLTKCLIKIEALGISQKINLVTSHIFFEGLIRIQAIFSVSLN